ncbi:MAG: MFS transporter [Anaerolineae bacterium]|jgi:GPH family glycoside/pentoside/hexuronide:cation symporter|nr:MFS transporter [Anaerolineae bacterium]
MNTTLPAPAEKVPLRTKLAFGCGDVGPAVATAIMSFFLLYFFTDVARLTPAAASVILLITKIWDAVNDPLIGLLSDRINTRWGRRRPWFLFGALPFGLAFFLLFQVPQLGDAARFAYYLVVSLLLDTMFTVVNVPYTALTPELSRDYDERTSLNSYRFAFSIAAGLIAAVTHPIIVDAVAARTDLRTGYAVSALVWAIVCVVPFVIAFLGTYERHTPEEAEAMPFVESLRWTFRNRAFRYATGIYLLSWLVVQTVSTLIVYYLTYWLRTPEITPLVLLGVQGSALVWLFVWNAVSRRMGKQGVYFIGMTMWIATSLVLFAVQPDWPAWSVIGLAILAGVGVAVAYLVPWAMLPDVIELDELQTGRRREGAFYGLFVLLQKLGLALGLFVVGQVLSATGYITPPPGATTPIVQPDSALLAIRVMMGPAAAVVLIAGMFLVARFPITRASHERTLRELEARRKSV